MKPLNKTALIIIMNFLLLPGCSLPGSTPPQHTNTIAENNTTEKNKAEQTSSLEPEVPVEINQPLEETATEPSKVENNSPAEIQQSLILKFGDKGERVVELQLKLNKFNYNLTVDGDFGYYTDFAVRNFQEKVNIECDGIAGPVTWDKLDSTPAQAPYLYDPFAYYQNIVNSNNCPSSTGYYIYVNLIRHDVCILTGSNYNWTVSKIYSCTVGIDSTPTIKGKFSVGKKGLSFITDNNLVCKYYTQIKGDYLFHSILYYPGGGIADSRLGMNLSHGCIRLSTENAYYIYKNIPYGTGIWIQ